MSVRNKMSKQITGWQERKYCQQILFTDSDWQQILQLVWYERRFKELLERIRTAGADEISVKKLKVKTPYDHHKINSIMRSASLPFRVYLHIPSGYTWQGGFIITRKFIPPA